MSVSILEYCLRTGGHSTRNQAMLQIASGKLFTNAPAQSNELRGVLYTNLQLFGREPIETAAGRLLPTDSLNNINAVVFEMTERIEDPPTAGALVSHGVDPYASDFAAVVSFVLNITCTTNAALSRQLMGGLSPLTGVRPDSLVNRTFDSLVWCQDEDVDQLIAFVADLIGLRRKHYLAAMRAIRNYVNGLHRIGDDPELTYTMMVASIESLVQEFKGEVPQWGDYAEDKRRRIDDALREADKQTAERVREALLEIEHVAMTRRFCDFALDHIQPSYFREAAAGLTHPIGRRGSKRRAKTSLQRKVETHTWPERTAKASNRGISQWGNDKRGRSDDVDVSGPDTLGS